MPLIALICLWIFAMIGGLIGYNITDKKTEEIIKYIEVPAQVPLCPIEEPKEDVECLNKLKDCWYEFEHNCFECEDFTEERNSLLRSRQECRTNEGKLLEQLQDCQNKLPF